MAGDPKSKKILIVDDDHSILNLLEILVRRDGFKVLLAASGDEALDQIKRKPDAILLDLMLPGDTNGIQVLEKLRATDGKVPPVIIVTAFGAHPEFAKVQQNPHVIAIVSKPINQQSLLDTLHRALNTAPAAVVHKDPPKSKAPEGK